ncbi:MAG TPA: alpha/beta hydrolase [Micromonosporaceae bacterium]
MGRLRDAADALTVAPDDVSLVYWLGYDAPQDIDALSYDASRAGAGQLTGFIDGLRSTHDPGPSHITVVGHSYGSTVVAEAALRGGLPVDDIIAAGSPGMHTDHATDLHLDPRHVWGGLAAGDLIGGALGELPFVHGEEPTDPAFGANQFVVDTQGHSAYWDPGSLSLRNQAAIVVGRYDLVALVHGQPPAD